LDRRVLILAEIMKKLERGVSGQGRLGVTAGEVNAKVRKQGPVGKTEGIWRVDGEWQDTEWLK